MNIFRKKQLNILSKLFAITTAFVLVFGSLRPALVLAQEADPIPTDTTAPQQVTETNDTTTNNTIDTTANTGDNSISSSPTPTPTDTITTDTTTPTPPQDPGVSPSAQDTPTDTPTGTPDPSITPDQTTSNQSTPDGNLDASGSANLTNTDTTVTNTTSSDASSGNNVISSPTPASPDASQGGPSPSASITTGTAVALTSAENDANTTSVNSQFVAQTINIYIDQNASLDLSDPVGLITSIIQGDPTDPTITYHVTSTNTATVNNNVSSTANSGINTATASDSAAINTGDAYSLVSLLNRVNFVTINSIVHVITINIFGTLNGDIILPTPMGASSAGCSTCNANVTSNNSATVTNTVNSDANSGGNSITASGSGTIETGNAQSAVDVTNLIDTNLIGADAFSLVINNFGTWDGSFVGWGSVTSDTGGLQIIYNSPSFDAGCGCATDATSTNTATVNNTVNSLANTGNNTINAGNGLIQTGTAVSDVSIVNLVNTFLYRSSALFGFINIFGNWHGNIGDAASLARAEATPTPPSTQASNQNSGSTVQDVGGALSVTNSNNVGAFVYPGDTVTFFITTHNTGTGKVYGTNLLLHLFKDGVDHGGQTYSIGDIDPQKGIKLTTGFVLSTKIQPGTYTAHAVVTGNVGPDNSSVSASADSTFTVYGQVLGAATAGDIGDSGASIVAAAEPTNVQVLGTSTRTMPFNSTNILLALLVLLLLIPTYGAWRLGERKEIAQFILTHNASWQLKLRAISMLML